MSVNFMALLKSKIVWANMIGLAVAVAAAFGVAPEITGKTAEYATVGLTVLNIILRMFSSSTIVEQK